MVRFDQAEKLLALATDERGNIEERRNAAMLVCRFLQDRNVLSVLRRMVEQYYAAQKK